MSIFWRLVKFALTVQTANTARIRKHEVIANDTLSNIYWSTYYKNMASLKWYGYQESFCGTKNPECATVDNYPSPNSHVEMRWDDVNEQLQTVPARQRNGTIVRGNDLGFLVLNQYFWNDDGQYKTIGLGVSVEDHEFIRPFFDKIVGKEGRDSGYWGESDIQEEARTYLDGLSQFNSEKDVRPFVTKLMHKIHVNVNLNDEDTQEFIALQSSVLPKIILPSSATGYGLLLRGARKTRAKFLNMYMDAMENDPRGVFAGLTGREPGGRLYLVAAGFMDSMLFAGGLSVASTIEVGLNALYSNTLPIEKEFKPLVTQEDVEQFVYETLRLFPPVVGFGWWEPGYNGNTGGSTYTERTVMNLAMASRDHRKWGSNYNKFVLRGLETYKQLMPTAFALPANEILKDGKLGPMSRGCPGATLSVVVAKAFFTEWIDQQRTSSSWVLTSTKPITFSDATPFVKNYATFNKSYKVRPRN